MLSSSINPQILYVSLSVLSLSDNCVSSLRIAIRRTAWSVDKESVVVPSP